MRPKEREIWTDFGVGYLEEVKGDPEGPPESGGSRRAYGGRGGVSAVCGGEIR